MLACSKTDTVTPVEDCSKATDIPQLTMLTSTMTNKTRFEQYFGEIVKIDSVYIKVKYVDKDGDFGLNSQSITPAFQKMANGALTRVPVDRQTVENQRYEILKYADNKKLSIDQWIEETASCVKYQSKTAKWGSY